MFLSAHYSTSSDMCTELPAAVSGMTTTSTFPVIVGTVVEVNCKPGHTLFGDNTITCIRDILFTIGRRPTCTLGWIIRTFLRLVTFKYIVR